MKTKSVMEAQSHLNDLLAEAKEESEPILLTDENGLPVGWLTAIGEDEIDDMIAKTEGFRRYVEEIRKPIPKDELISHERVMEELAKLED